MSDTELLTQTTCPLEQLEDTYIKIVKTPKEVQVQCQGKKGELVSMLVLVMDTDADLRRVLYSAAMIHSINETFS